MSTENDNVGILKDLNDITDHEETRLEYIEAIKEKLESMPEFKIEIDSEELKKKAQEALDAIEKEKIKQETESKLTHV